MKAVIVDNYDSFTYNLYQYVCELVPEVRVVRNDAMTAAQIMALEPDCVVLSPGPKDPQAAGVSLELISRFGARLPILGVCLGHQCINEAFGGRTVRARRATHGMTSRISTDGKGVYRGLPRQFDVMRYHSLAADPATVSDDLIVTASTEDGTIMGLRHRRYPVEGVQFHPESFMTEHGLQMIRNYLATHVKGAAA